MMTWTYRDSEYIYLLIYVWCGMGSWKCYFAHLSLSNQRSFSSQELLKNHVHKYLQIILWQKCTNSRETFKRVSLTVKLRN